jgi:hypothetical protein
MAGATIVIQTSPVTVSFSGASGITLSTDNAQLDENLGLPIRTSGTGNLKVRTIDCYRLLVGSESDDGHNGYVLFDDGLGNQVNLNNDHGSNANVSLPAGNGSLIVTNADSGVIPGSYADDAAASIAGVPVGYPYHTSGAVKVRLS